MTSRDIIPNSGKILVRKLPDDFRSKHGILLSSPVNSNFLYVEVVSRGPDTSENMNVKIEVSSGDRCIILGRGIYETLFLDDGEFYIVTQADIVICLE